jgi:signal transduction histidine kinase
MRPVRRLAGRVRQKAVDYLPPLRDPRFWVTQALVLAVFAVHVILHATTVSGSPSAFIPDAFIGVAYALPMLYAALAFGFRGAVATTVLVAVLLLPYVVQDAVGGGERVDFAGHLLTLVILVIVTPVVGYVVQGERSARRAHEAAERRYRELFEGSGVPAVVLDEAGRIQEANPAAGSLLEGTLEGRDLADVLGKQAADGLLGPDPPARLRVAQGLELRPVVSRAENSGGHRLTQVLFQDVTEEASGHRRARAWALAVLAAQEEERRRIAHELHDEALQLVVELRRQVERAARSAPGAEDQLHDARDLADALIGELRTVAFRLRPPDLDDLGLVASLERLATEAGRHGTAVELHADNDATPLPPAAALAFYRVAQEALTNAEHHGHASHVTLHLSLKPDAISLQIQDDGIGFDVKRADSQADQGHLGLVGMRERMQIIGGTLQIRSATGQGTTITATAER